MREIDDKEQGKNQNSEPEQDYSSERSSQSIPLIPDWTRRAAASAEDRKKSSHEASLHTEDDATLKTSGEDEEDKEGEEGSELRDLQQEQEILEEDFSKEKLLGGRWHWSSLPISSVYELTLLRWETGIQKELGNSIINLLKSLQQMVAEV
jgi:hypothetical protein